MSDLGNEAHPPSREDLNALSDLSGARLQEFKAQWPRLSAARRLDIMTRLGELAEEHFELNINAASRAVLDDADGRVRAAAIRNLWEDERTDLIAPFLHTLVNDSSAEARAAAASALGVYVYQGEMEELPVERARQIEDALLNVFESSDSLEVRRRALESVGYSQRPEAAEAILKAYTAGDELLKVSALFAMGRSLDQELWSERVIKDLSDVSPRVRLEAARAAGELQLQEAVPGLGEAVQDVDPDVQAMSCWALGEIGGEEARRLLEKRLRTADQALAQVIDDALANAELMDDLLEFTLVDFDDDEDDQRARLN